MFDEIETRFANAMFEKKLAQSSDSRATVIVKREKDQAVFRVSDHLYEEQSPISPKLKKINSVPRVRKFGSPN